jgi:hypothetical protein
VKLDPLLLEDRAGFDGLEYAFSGFERSHAQNMPPLLRFARRERAWESGEIDAIGDNADFGSSCKR